MTENDGNTIQAEQFEKKTGTVFLPIRAMFEVTKRCVNRCVHCYISDFTGKNELTTDEVKHVLDQLAELNCLELTFTGGEVFCRNDFLEICRYARKLHFAIIIFTEATMITEKIADELKEIAPWRVEVTLLGPDAELHDRLTGVKGSFDRTLRGMKRLIDREVTLKGKSVIMKENFDRYGDLRTLFESLGITYILDPQVTPMLDGAPGPTSHRIDRDQMKQLLADETIAPGTIVFGTSAYTEATNVSKDLPMCKAGLNFCHIDSQGNVLPCVQLPVIAGNLREASLKEIWFDSELLLKLRESKIKDLEKCGDCDLFVLCYRCPGLALLEDGNMFGPSKTGCFNAELRREVQEERDSEEGIEGDEESGD